MVNKQRTLTQSERDNWDKLAKQSLKNATWLKLYPKDADEYAWARKQLRSTAKRNKLLVNIFPGPNVKFVPEFQFAFIDPMNLPTNQHNTR